MDAVLIVITLGALGLAIGLAIVGWRLLQTNRSAETADRVEALRALAAELDAPLDWTPPATEPAALVERPVLDVPPPAVVPVLTRFATLAPEDAGDTDWDLTLGAGSEPAEPAVATLFAGPAVDARPYRRLLMAGAVAVVLLASAGTVYAVVRPRATAPRRAADGRVPATTVPLDLLSLTESVETDGTFTVTGLVGNPTGGHPADQVVAVVYLFDQAGHYFATSRAAIDVPALAPGDQSPFVVKVPHGATAARYRVGFREPDGAVVAHVDRRGQPIEGMTGGDTAPPRGAGNE